MSKNQAYYVYILESKKGHYYVGSTNDVEKRLKAHKSGKGAKFTRAFGVKALLYHEKLKNKSLALKREAEIKSWSREEKNVFLASQMKSSL